MRILSVLLFGLACAGACAAADLSQTVQAPPFGTVTLIRHADQPKGLVILFADEPAQRRDSLAAALAELDYAVAQVRPAHPGRRLRGVFLRWRSVRRRDVLLNRRRLIGDR